MHACLNVDEIVRLLAHELVASESEGKATAIELAYCCKTLEGPVLNVLWGTQDQLDLLLETFSISVWDETVAAYVSLSTDSLSPLHSTAWMGRFSRECRRPRNGLASRGMPGGCGCSK